jgi:hypothetical protein
MKISVKTEKVQETKQDEHLQEENFETSKVKTASATVVS